LVLISQNQLLHTTKFDMQYILDFLQILAKYGDNIAYNYAAPIQNAKLCSPQELINNTQFKLIIIHEFN
jgi:hypothetical protein